jgi:hypothetical protein
MKLRVVKIFQKTKDISKTEVLQELMAIVEHDILIE